jgi:hypothetical protein
MTKLIGISFLALLAISVSPAQEKQTTVYSIKNAPNMTSTVTGSLKDGKKLASLGWASSSSNACFPATQNSKFTGNHVLFVTDMPPHSIMTVTVTPKTSGANLSIYGYQIGAGKTILPENLQSCVTCEADHKWDYPKRGKVQTDARTITFNSIGNSYSIVIGIAGADGLTEGDFSVAVSLKQ